METIYKELKTPCFIFEKNEFIENLNSFKKQLYDFLGDNYSIGYSFKTNYLDCVLNAVLESGCMAEVVSEKEYEMAVDCGFKKNHIIYNGPLKSKESFIDAVTNGAIVNIDSKRELRWLDSLNNDRIYCIGLRVNFDLESVLPGHTVTGADGGRFGFCDDNDELEKAISKINKMNNIRICGLHMHTSNKSKKEEVYEELIKRAIDINFKYKLSLEYIDVGGGFFGGGDNGEAYRDYVSRIYSILKRYNMEGIRLIVEPGASVVATAFKYLTEIADEKTTTRNHFVLVDGTRMHIDPFFARNKYSFKIITDSTNIVDKQVICGSTCMEKDRLMVLEHRQELKEGDRILFDVVGGYTVCFNSNFILKKPFIYEMDDKGRTKQVEY